MGTSLKSRILVHNSGSRPAIFVIPSWQQPGGQDRHTATDAKGAAINVTSTLWTTMAQMKVFRLAPGEYCEAAAPGIGVGGRTETEDWANVRVGSWIAANAGDDVRFSPMAVELRFAANVVGTRAGGGSALQSPNSAADLWNQLIAERVQYELPIPENAADREQLLRRATFDLYGEQPTQAEIDAFVADKSPAAANPETSAELLVTRLRSHRPDVAPFTGALKPGPIHFRVLPPDPNAAKKPRTVTGSGYYNLPDKHRLHVESGPDGNRRTSKAVIHFRSTDQTPVPPCEIALPDGHLTWAIAWEPDSNVLWITQKGHVRRYDFTDPSNIRQTRIESADVNIVPATIRDALRSALEQAVSDNVDPPPAAASP